MDVTINVKLTPTEARQLMGLPDVQPLQAAMLAKIEQTMVEQASKISADSLLNTWFTTGPGAIDMFRDMAREVLSHGAARDNVRAKSEKVDRT